MPVDKISEEWVVMRYFREKYKLFPKGKLVKSESPDFVLQVNRKKRIGIELTRFDYLANEAGSRNVLFQQLMYLIRQKEDKLRIYQKKLLNEYWLIISTESPEIFTEVMNNLLVTRAFTSSYDKLFLFDLFSGRITEKHELF
ncbi:MAG TPA: hypothetical protein ENJ14_03675 [Bacteroidetes bacterium]|nr:MAG: hypothetical protein DRJ02_12975 [Bacteroidota bacterium]HHL58019.1 hypothetical protein [Bacteroidota bacterium]